MRGKVGGGREGKIRLVRCARFSFRLRNVGRANQIWSIQNNYIWLCKIHVISIFHLGDG